jgi:hypothetical protein
LRDRAALGALLWPTGDADAPGFEGIGSGGERVRALGRLRGDQLPGARRRPAARRRRQVPLGGGRQGRRGVRSRAQLPRPRRGRPDRARVEVAATLGREEKVSWWASGSQDLAFFWPRACVVPSLRPRYV